MLPSGNIPQLCEILARLYEECTDDNPGSKNFSYESYTLKVVNDLQFMNILDMENEKCIIVYGAGSSSLECDEKIFQEEQFSNSQSDDTLNLTGCPLECPFNETIFECTTTFEKLVEPQLSVKYMPLPESQACGVLNVFRKLIKYVPDKKDSAYLKAPFVVLCDGKDAENTIAMGLQRLQDSLRWFRVRCKDGRYLPSELPSLDHFKKEHLWGISHNVIEAEANAKYEILGITKHEDDDNSPKSRITLDCVWKNVQQLLEFPNEAASCFVHFNVVFGDVRSIAHAKWKELQLLQRVVQAIISKNVVWSTLNESGSVLSDLHKLLESVKVDNRKSLITSSHKTSEESRLHTLLVEGRTKNLDLTDNLWMVLKGCESKSQLEESLRLVLNTVRDGEIKPVIFSRNNTILGTILTDVLRRKTGLPDFEIINPVHLLAEIGIEKLKQDYMNILLGSGLVSKDNLNPLISNIVYKNWNESLISLLKLHCVTDLIMLCQTYINPPESLLSKFARMALMEIATETLETNSRSFSFQIDRQAVFKTADRFTLREWKVSLKSSQDTYAVQTTVQLTTDHPLLAHDRSLLSSELNAEMRYYMCTSSAVQDRILMAENEC